MNSVPAGLATALADRYRLDRELGRGGMATVYLAHDLKYDRDVALKVLKPELAAVLGRERFLAEIHLTAKLDHPHILTLLDSGESDGFLWYVVHFIRGESLRQKLEREKQLGVEEALAITRQVAGALDYAHRQGVIHRDIKPENILLREDHAILADFGIALAVKEAGGNRLTETGLSLGTPQYMSPEQATGDRQLDARSDVYSLAAVLYELLAGEPPHSGPTVQAIIAKLMTVVPAPLRMIRPTVPGAVEAAVQKALSKVPGDRWNACRDFGEALTHPGLAIERPRSHLRTPLANWAIGIGLVAVVAVTGALVFRPRGEAHLDPKRIVIAPFENRTGDPALDQLGLMVADWLTQGLTGTRLVEVVDSRSLMASLRAARPVADPEGQAHQLAKDMRAGTLVSGSIYRLGDSLRVQARIFDVSSGGLQSAVDPIMVSVSTPDAALDPLREHVIGALAGLLDARLNNRAAVSSSPPTYAAYQEFLLGMENYGGNLGQDLVHFRYAATLDTTFVQAVLWVGIAYADLGEFKPADSVFQSLEPRRSRLLPYDQANLDYFSRGFVHGDWEASYRGARRMLEAEPRAEHAKWAVALSAAFINRPEEALAIVATIDTTTGWGKIWRTGVLNLETWSRHRLARYDEELRSAMAIAASPDPGTARYGTMLRFRALLGLARRDEAITLLEGADGFWLCSASHELLAHGYPEDSRAAAVKAVEWYRNRIQAGSDSLLFEQGSLALALFDAGQWTEARTAAHRQRVNQPADPQWPGILGVIAAREGDASEVARDLHALAQWSGAYQFGLPSYWRASILAVLHRRDQAIAALQQAFREGFTSFRYGRTHLLGPEFDFMRDDPRVRALNEPAG